MQYKALFSFCMIACFRVDSAVPSFQIHNKTEHALRIGYGISIPLYSNYEEETVLPGKSMRVSMVVERREYVWRPIEIAYHGSDQRFSGLIVTRTPTGETLDTEAGPRWQKENPYPDWGVFPLSGPDPDIDLDAYSSGLKRIFGFEIREIK